MDYYFLLSAIETRDGFYRPALCLKTKEEAWYVFTDSTGLCFRKIKETIREDFSTDEMKKRYFGIYRIISQKWNEISAVLKKSSVL